MHELKEAPSIKEVKENVQQMANTHTEDDEYKNPWDLLGRAKHDNTDETLKLQDKRFSLQGPEKEYFDPN